MLKSKLSFPLCRLSAYQCQTIAKGNDPLLIAIDGFSPLLASFGKKLTTSSHINESITSTFVSLFSLLSLLHIFTFHGSYYLLKYRNVSKLSSV